jgi:hypothetical protein
VGTHGNVAWAGLVAYVVAYDTYALAAGTETLSGAFGRALAHPKARWPVLAAWGITTLHLTGRLPPRIDPFAGYGNLLAQVRGLRSCPLDGLITEA